MRLIYFEAFSHTDLNKEGDSCGFSTYYNHFPHRFYRLLYIGHGRNWRIDH